MLTVVEIERESTPSEDTFIESKDEEVRGDDATEAAENPIYNKRTLAAEGVLPNMSLLSLCDGTNYMCLCLTKSSFVAFLFHFQIG